MMMLALSFIFLPVKYLNFQSINIITKHFSMKCIRFYIIYFLISGLKSRKIKKKLYYLKIYIFTKKLYFIYLKLWFFKNISILSRKKSDICYLKEISLNFNILNYFSVNIFKIKVKYTIIEGNFTFNNFNFHVTADIILHISSQHRYIFQYRIK